jgi:transcriptional regulator with XRE-family HTH domain
MEVKSLRQLAKELGVTHSYLSRVKNGKKPASDKVRDALNAFLHPEIKEPVEIKPLPDLNIPPFRPEKVRRDEEDICIVLSDHHAGRETESYSLDIYKKRMSSLLDTLQGIVNLHRPVRKCYVFRLGDMVQGENIYQGSHIESCKVGAYNQIYDYALPTLQSFYLSLLQGVESIDDYDVPGNHGRYEKTAPASTNWDSFLTKALQTKLQNQKNITFHPANKFYNMAYIRGFAFFMVHGNQVKANQGIPLFALRRKFQEWYAHVGGFHYAYCGHFHAGSYDHINSVADYTMCPPMVTGDDWALEVIGRSSKPVQLCFGIHPKYGRTWEYKLYCDKAFVPKPFEITIKT